MNGWTNYSTWNIALFIQNEYPLYKAALSYASYQQELNLPVRYEEFCQYNMDLLGQITPDGVSWTHPELDTDELDEMLQEMVG